jgi:hypothetical protein
LIAAVSSGYAKVGIVTYADALSALSALAAGKITLLLDPLHVPPALAKELVPQEYPAFVVFGLRSTLRDHRGAVVRFLRALRQANADLLKASTEQLGTTTASLPAFAGTPPSLLATAWAAVLPQIPTGPQAGSISQSAWRTALRGFADWGLPGYRPTDPTLSYQRVVDMSYFNEAG